MQCETAILKYNTNWIVIKNAICYITLSNCPTENCKRIKLLKPYLIMKANQIEELKSKPSSLNILNRTKLRNW